MTLAVFTLLVTAPQSSPNLTVKQMAARLSVMATLPEFHAKKPLSDVAVTRWILQQASGLSMPDAYLEKDPERLAKLLDESVDAAISSTQADRMAKDYLGRPLKVWPKENLYPFGSYYTWVENSSNSMWTPEKVSRVRVTSSTKTRVAFTCRVTESYREDAAMFDASQRPRTYSSSGTFSKTRYGWSLTEWHPKAPKARSQSRDTTVYVPLPASPTR